MGWYIVVKTIKGHRYRYRQRTWREGDRVRTESVYLGPADGAAAERSKSTPSVSVDTDGELPGVGAARFAKNSFAFAPFGAGDGMKSPEAWLAEYFGGQWSNRERAYILRETRRAKFLIALRAVREKRLAVPLFPKGDEAFKKTLDALMRATENVSTTSAARDVADEQALIESLFDPANSAGGGKLLWPRRYAAKGGKFTPDKRLFALATKMGVTGITRAWQGNASWERLDGAWYNPAVDAVQMPDASRFEEESEFNMVFLHELTHATQRRVGRDKRNYAEEELVAELGANLIARRIGLHPKALRQSAYYLQVWLTRCGSQSASRAFAEREARRAADYIMEKWRLVNTTK